MKQVSKHILIVLSALLSIALNAQNSEWKATVSPIKESGYYNIELDQQLVGVASKDFSNLRIYNTSDGITTEVPYFVRDINPIIEEKNRTKYSIEQLTQRKGFSQFVIENKLLDSIRDLYVTINQEETNLSVGLKGSNDTKNWSVVKPKTPIHYSKTTNDKQTTLYIRFPEGKYKYYEVALENDSNSQLKINQVESVKGSQIYGQFSKVDLGDFVVVNNTKDNSTEIQFPALKSKYVLDKIEFDIDTKMEYLRKVIMEDSVTNSRQQFILNSSKSKAFLLNAYNIDKTSIHIANFDNPPLKIAQISAYALKRYACAYLEKGEIYTVIVNQKELAKPKYDIVYFKEKIPSVLPIIQTLNIQETKSIAEPQPIVQSEKAKDSSAQLKVILWIVLIAVTLFIAYLCYQTFKKIGD